MPIETYSNFILCTQLICFFGCIRTCNAICLEYQYKPIAQAQQTITNINQLRSFYAQTDQILRMHLCMFISAVQWNSYLKLCPLYQRTGDHPEKHG